MRCDWKALTTVDADLVVVGGGVAGTLTVLLAALRGLEVAWVAPPVGPADQSAHWHGYLHRGAFFNPRTEATLIADLAENWTFWAGADLARFRQRVDTHAVAPTALWAEGFADRIRSAPQVGEVEWLPAGTITVPTGEGVLDGPEFLAAAHAAAAACATRIVEPCRSIRRDGDGWRAIMRSGSSVTARQAIIAAGPATAGLVAGLVPTRRVTVRASRMLVLRGAALPQAALIAPSHQNGGLFLASRVGPGGEAVWLVSDNFSTPAEEGVDPLLDAWWACSMVERLAGLVGDELLHGTTATAYVAAKSSLRTEDVLVPSDGVVVDDTGGLACLTPAKWSNCPTTAHEVLTSLGHRLVWDDLHPQLSARIAAATPEPARIVETWQTLGTGTPTERLRTPGLPTLLAARDIFAAAA